MSTQVRRVPAVPVVSERVKTLLAEMTLEEKLAQIVGYWLDHGGQVVAPMADEMSNIEAGSDAPELAKITEHGLGHFTRVYGTRPVDPVARARWLWDEQRRLKRETRLGIPALVHEECLTGLAAWKAASFPTPLAWGAAFNPNLVEEMARLIGQSMRDLGIHQGLAPVLDVIRDPRWGRVEESIAEDPYVVGTIGTAYVRGLQATGIHATLKHFVGYSAALAGRNHAPVALGPREINDVLVPPFEMAIRDGQVKSVMNSYSDIDGIPVGASAAHLTDLLRGDLGFEGTVVADYFSVAFLEVMHAVAADRGGAAALALEAGIDIELPSGDAYLEPLAQRIRAGEFDEAYVDRAVLRALTQKEELGLLDDDAYTDEAPSEIDLDSPRHRAVAYQLAQESVVLLKNDGILPLNRAENTPRKVAIIGPNADAIEALQGCYSFVNHVLPHFPDHEIGIEISTVRQEFAPAAERAGMPEPEIFYAQGCEVEGEDRSGFDAAISQLRTADLALVVVGDRAGLFGRGTVGEGNDVQSLRLPGVQRELVEAAAEAGVPVVLVLITGRPYELAWALDGPISDKIGAVVQTFFPGERGAEAICDVITGAAVPSGRLPVSLPRSAGAQPFTYLHPILGGPSDVTVADSTPVRPFGFGLSYTTFAYSDFEVPSSAGTGGEFDVSVTVTNTGDVAGTEVVQVYGRDVIGSVARPMRQLLAYQRVELESGASKRVTFTMSATRFAFSDQQMRRVVEPGDVEIWVASHAGVSDEAADTHSASEGAIKNERRVERRALPGVATARARVELTGDVHFVTPADARIVTARVEDA
ncbi:MAG TPA: glycoside hydrolase family 3 N-terminal domain-containing protein [Actinomycetales bacterium]|nr:glycoside hydrolase family 3 N-terminal domain-containing protein [Actinomycetales bacterium]